MTCRERDTRRILAQWEELDEAAFDDDEGDADEHDVLARAASYGDHG